MRESIGRLPGQILLKRNNPGLRIEGLWPQGCQQRAFTMARDDTVQVASRELGAGCSSRNPCPFALHDAPSKRPTLPLQVFTRSLNWRGFSLTTSRMGSTSLSQPFQWVDYPLISVLSRNVHAMQVYESLAMSTLAHHAMQERDIRGSWAITLVQHRLEEEDYSQFLDFPGTELTLLVPSADRDACQAT